MPSNIVKDPRPEDGVFQKPTKCKRGAGLLEDIVKVVNLLILFRNKGSILAVFRERGVKSGGLKWFVWRTHER